MIEIFIPEHLRSDVGTRVRWDSYAVDLKLKDGRVKRNVSAREGVAIQESLVIPGNYKSYLDFNSEDIVAVRPHAFLTPFFVTEAVRNWKRK